MWILTDQTFERHDASTYLRSFLATTADVALARTPSSPQCLAAFDPGSYAALVYAAFVVLDDPRLGLDLLPRMLDYPSGATLPERTLSLILTRSACYLPELYCMMSPEVTARTRWDQDLITRGRVFASQWRPDDSGEGERRGTEVEGGDEGRNVDGGVEREQDTPRQTFRDQVNAQVMRLEDPPMRSRGGAQRRSKAPAFNHPDDSKSREGNIRQREAFRELMRVTKALTKM